LAGAESRSIRAPVPARAELDVPVRGGRRVEMVAALEN